MGSLRKALAVPLFVLAAACAGETPAMADPSPPEITYRDLWTDAKGQSHFTMCKLHHFDLKSISKPAGPQWQDHLSNGDATVIATVQPDKWDGAWHEDPKPQWIIPLSGTWFIQAMDGTRFNMGPGEIALGEDQNTIPASSGPMAGKKGHLAGNVGPGEVKLMVIQLGDLPASHGPCRFK